MDEMKKPIDAETEKNAAGNVPAQEPAPKKRFDIGGLFFNNRFVLAFSLVCAMVMWLGMAIGNVETRTRVIYNVPLKIVVAAEEDLMVFSQSHTAASVVVEGNNVIINRISADDVSVVATLDQTAGITADANGGMPTYQLAVTAQKNGNELADFEVVSCSLATVTVKADVPVEMTFPLTNAGQYTVASDCYVNAPAFSADTVTVAGPRSVVNRIYGVNVEYKLDKPLTENYTVTTGLTCVNEDGEAIARDYLELSVDTVDVSFNVYAKKTLALKPTLLNMPVGFPENRITVTPATVEVAAPRDVLADLEELTLDTVLDFTDFNTTSTTKNVAITLPTGFRNINDTTLATVSVDLSGYTQGSFNVTQINVKNPSANQYVELLTESLEIMAVGPITDITSLTGNSFYCVVDMTNINNMFGTMQLPVTVEIHNNDTCWVVGTYSVNVQISDTPPVSEDPESSGAESSETP